MTEPKPIDPGRLAALIDGRLDPAEAAAIRAQLAGTDDDAVSVFADAVAIADTKEQVLPIARRRRGWTASLSAVAAVLLVAVLTRSRWHGESERDRYSIAAYAAAVPPSAPLPETPVWSSSRGSSGAGTVARSVRLGALATDLRVAMARGDTAFQSIAGALAANIADVPGMGSLPQDIRTFSRDPTDSTRLQEAVARAAGLGDSGFVSAGAWLEAARLASTVSDTAFFLRYPADRALASLRKPSAEPPPGAVERVLQAGGTRPWDFRRLTETITATLASLAR